jgi:hypothetical protein
LADTARVNVNDVTSIPTLTTLKLHTPGDSARFAIHGDLSSPDTITVDMLDQSGNPIDSTQFYLTAQDTTIVNLPAFNVSGGHWASTVQASWIGQTRLIVEATVYGVSKSDTVEVAAGYPTFVEDKFQGAGDTTSFSAAELTISHGGLVAFLNKTDKPVDILFDDSTAVESATAEQLTAIVGESSGVCFFWFVCPEVGNAGNIYALQPVGDQALFVTNVEFRRFPTPGTYQFHSRSPNANGVIHVE